MLLGLLANQNLIKLHIGDTGTTGNFVLPGALVDDVKVATDPIEIEMPNSSIEKAHICATCGSQNFPKN